MDVIKGLENGFFHTWETGSSKHRTEVFKEFFKEHVDAGKFIRDIQSAPRDARYKIDHYYNENTSEENTIPFPYLNFFLKVISVLDIDETFNWKKRLIDEKEEYTNGDFTIGFGPIKHIDYTGKKFKLDEYYFKYKGEINTLNFQSSPELMDYSDPFWKRYEGLETGYASIGDLLHNLSYFLQHKGLN
jgi:hypothetical protein